MKTLGVTNLILEIEGDPYSTQAIVIQGGIRTPLIGQDLIENNEWSIGFSKGRWVLRNNEGRILAHSIDSYHHNYINAISEIVPEPVETEYITSGVYPELIPTPSVGAVVEKYHEEKDKYFTPTWMEYQTNRFRTENLPPTTLEPMEIRLKEGEQISKNKPHFMNPKKEEACRNKINDMLAKGHLRPSNNERCSPVIVIQKAQLDAEGKERHRVVVDLRELNDKCVKIGKPIPSIERIFDSIPNEDTVFTILDLTDGFHQCPLTEESKQYTAIVVPFGKYEYNVTPQGFTNAPGEFQERIYNILETARHEGRISKTVKQFIDDILISARNLPELLCRTEEVLDELHANGLQIVPLKCQFGASEVSFLGFNISSDGKSLGEHLLIDIETKVEQTITYYYNHIHHTRENP